MLGKKKQPPTHIQSEDFSALSSLIKEVGKDAKFSPYFCTHVLSRIEGEERWLFFASIPKIFPKLALAALIFSAALWIWTFIPGTKSNQSEIIASSNSSPLEEIYAEVSPYSWEDE